MIFLILLNLVNRFKNGLINSGQTSFATVAIDCNYSDDYYGDRVCIRD